MPTLTRQQLQAMAVHDVIEGVDLRAVGVTPENLKTLLRREHLFREFEDVFLTTDRPTDRGKWLAGVRRMGDGAQLCEEPAAVMWGLLADFDGWPHVLVGANRGKRKIQGIVIRRTTRPDARATRDDIPVTTLHRTLDDISRTLPTPSLTAAVGRAERKHAVDLAALHASARSPKLRGVLATYVAGRGLTDSVLEARFYEIAAGSSLGRPDTQRRMPGGRVDFIWHAARLIVEVDGFGTHSGRVAHREDLRRDRANWRAGFDTLRYTWGDVVLTPAEVKEDLDLARRRLVAA